MSLLEVEELSVRFATDRGPVPAVSGVSFVLEAGETLALVGESGSGKSSVVHALMGLHASPQARVESRVLSLDGRDLRGLSEHELARVRGREIALVFQDPLSALHPLLTIGRQLEEVLARHTKMPRRARRSACAGALAEVGIAEAEKRLAQFPHQLSGGMRQRVGIAMALLARPKVLLADEPTTALDTTIQAQVLELLAELRRRHGTAVVLVTHDLGVVARHADRVHVLYAGRTAEEGRTREIIESPRHPYTRALLACVPRIEDDPRAPRPSLPGSPPDLARLPDGCAFAPRCGLAHERCRQVAPPLELVDPGSPRRAACFAHALVAAFPVRTTSAGAVRS